MRPLAHIWAHLTVTERDGRWGYAGKLTLVGFGVVECRHLHLHRRTAIACAERVLKKIDRPR